MNNSIHKILGWIQLQMAALVGLHLFKQLAVESCNLSQTKNKIIVVKPEFYKMIFFSQMVKNCQFEIT